MAENSRMSNLIRLLWRGKAFCLALCVAAVTGVACGPVTPSQAIETVTAPSTQSQIEPNTPTLGVPTVEPTLTVVPTSAATKEPQGVTPPLPEALIEASAGKPVLFSCADSTTNGEIWSGLYPYEDMTRISPQDQAGYYYPIWSPDGQMIAYIRTSTENPLPPRITENAKIIEYPDGDSIWVARPDGSNARQIGRSRTRVEGFLPNGGCLVTAGIVSLDGWSSDGTRILFSYISEQEGPGLYSANLNTQQFELLSKSIFSPSISPDADQVAVIGSDGVSVEIWSLKNQAPQSSTRMALPDGVSSRSVVNDIAWADNSHLIIGIDERSKFSIWELSLGDLKWTELGDLRNMLPRKIIAGGGVILACFSPGLQLALGELVPSSTELSPILREGTIECDNPATTFDSQGLPVLALVDTAGVARIQLVRMTTQPAVYVLEVGAQFQNGKSLSRVSFSPVAP